MVFYGREFNLKSLSVVALSETECDYWLKGLEHLRCLKIFSDSAFH